MTLSGMAQTAQAAQTMAAQNPGVDWPFVVGVAGVIIVGGTGLVCAILAWIWVSHVAWIRQIVEDQRQHLRDDAAAFRDITALIESNHSQLLAAVDQRKHRRDHEPVTG